MPLQRKQLSVRDQEFKKEIPIYKEFKRRGQVSEGGFAFEIQGSLSLRQKSPFMMPSE
jgi:hypothetical protein